MCKNTEKRCTLCRITETLLNHDAALMYQYKKMAEKPYFPSYSSKTGMLDLMALALSDLCVWFYFYGSGLRISDLIWDRLVKFLKN